MNNLQHSTKPWGFKIHPATPHHTSSTISHLPYHTIPYHTTSNIPYQPTPYHIYHTAATIQYHTIPYHTTSTIPYYTTSTIPYHIYHTMSQVTTLILHATPDSTTVKPSTPYTALHHFAIKKKASFVLRNLLINFTITTHP